uniref:Solute carrier family 12 member 6 n=1 Tax=Steinernema glaseri TaxID=37863 RepID=A0A1I7YN09_9BILA
MVTFAKSASYASTSTIHDSTYHTPSPASPVVSRDQSSVEFPEDRIHDHLEEEHSLLRPHEPKGLLSWGSVRKKSDGGHNLELFDEPHSTFVSSYLRAYTTPGPLEREESKGHNAGLGVMLGVYLPTIQHILGVTMFIRLAWVVGIAGIGGTCGMLLLCCLCTFLTSISVSAVATNGTIEGGGAYFMISRNLGPEFGSAVGILFYLANTVATSMYLVGGVEIVLYYIFPELTIGGPEVHSDTGLMGMMTHNLRLYATLLLLLEFCIVAMGVKFVQLLAPVSLLCVIVSILSCYAGGIVKTVDPSSGQSVCMLGEHLLQAKVVLPEGHGIDEICNFCIKNGTQLIDHFCGNGTCSEMFTNNNVQCVNAFPGFASSAFVENLGSSYVMAGEYVVGKAADRTSEVFQDVNTSFFVLLAIYFPAVTGILTGANMSGDLKNPQSSIPGGTIAATLTTSFIYFSLAIVFGTAISGPLLRDKYGISLGGMVVASLAWPSHWVLLIGSFTSTFGAALQCLCSAPRLLQSIAKDDVIPALSPFAKVTKNNEPIIGLILTTVIAELAILLGQMDQIAAVVDFFFLMCYAFVNFICALHSLLGAPNWRPRFKYYHWSLSVLGAALCFFIMFSTHWEYALISLALCVVIYKYVEWKGAKKEWGDGIRGLALTTAQYSLMKIEDKDPHPKNWRPQVLLIHSMPWSKETVDLRYLNLLNFSSQLKAGRGLSIVVSFLRGNPTSHEDREKAEEVKKRMEFDMGQIRLRGFAKSLIYGENQITGSLTTLIQSAGIGGLRPNTLLLAWPIHDRKAHVSVDSEYKTFIDKLHAGAAMDMALLVAKGINDFPACSVKLTGTLDVYWIVQDGGLCILMAYLLKQNKVWRGCKLRVIAIAQELDNNTKMQQELEQYVYQLRIDAKIMVVELTDPEISQNAFERTLLMEERTQFMKELQAEKEKAKAAMEGKIENELQLDVDFVEKEVEGSDTGESVNTEDDREDPSEKAIVDIEDGQEKPKRVTMAVDHENEKDQEKDRKMRALDRKKVRKMHTAVRLNEVILEHSKDSQLVLLNLPRPPRSLESLDDYIHYLEVLSDKVKRVLFVRGAGQEVITTIS